MWHRKHPVLLMSEYLMRYLNEKQSRNEFNENLYKQQYISLKNELIEKLKNDLQPEIEGLETIAESLSEVQKERIQRRITRIYKLLQKLGEQYGKNRYRFRYN